MAATGGERVSQRLAVAGAGDDRHRGAHRQQRRAVQNLGQLTDQHVVHARRLQGPQHSNRVWRRRFVVCMGAYGTYRIPLPDLGDERRRHEQGKDVTFKTPPPRTWTPRRSATGSSNSTKHSQH